jgi:hypothetical protein
MRRVVNFELKIMNYELIIMNCNKWEIIIV